MIVKTVRWTSGRLSVWCKMESKVSVFKNLPCPPMESELKTTGLVSNEVTVLGSQHPNSDRSETKHPASDGELDRRLDSTQSEEQRYYSDTERHHRKSVKVTSKLKNTTALGSSKSRFQRFSAIYISKDALPVQKESVQNNEGAQSLDPEEVQRFDDISIRIPSHLPSTKKIHPPEMTEPKQNVNAEDTGMETSKNRFSVTVESERITSKSVERDVFDFRSSSDSAGKFQVSEAKRKVLGKKRLSFDQVNNLKVATGSKKRRRGGDAVHKRSDLKTFFTEDSSSGGTEHSWLLDSHIKVTPNIADYSRRKKRKKSVLRVLPLSLESSEDEKKPREATESLTPKENQEMSQIGQILSDFSDQQHTPVQHVKRIKTNDFSIRNNPVIGTSLLTPPDTQEMKLPSNRFPGRISTKGAGPTLQQSPSIPSEGPPSENNYLTKDEVSLTPSPHFKAKRLFTSAEKYKKAEELQDMVQEIEKSHSEFDDEDSSEPNISAAFRSFTEEMRKKLRFSYRKMEQHTKQSLQSAERKTLKLLNQIHKCRLQKLNMFEETVGQELKNLEEDAQTLKNLEEETLNFWKQQSLKFSQFYENQKQRMNAGILSPEDKRGLSKEMQVKTAHREQSAADRMKN